jgi:heptosyltransferase-1
VHVLIVKTSSLGDLIHTLPAVTDAAAALPAVRFDWLAEEAFVQIPGWHPAVQRVIPIALRRWRKGWRRAWRQGEPQRFVRQLRERTYDQVIDAQGLLLKSGLPAALARGPACGYDRASAREPWVSWTYRERHPVPVDLHAVARLRRLFAACLGYPEPPGEPDYGIRVRGRPTDTGRPYLLFLHATTWPSKHWPVAYWAELTRIATDRGYRVYFPWHAPEDRLQAERVMQGAGCGELLPRQDLEGMAGWLSGAAGVVGVDTGLAHLAAAVGTPAVCLYGPTRVDLTGALGPRQRNLAAQFPCAPCRRRECGFTEPSAVQPACFADLPPGRVWENLQQQMSQR